jgi:hypothetical protein
MSHWQDLRNIPLLGFVSLSQQLYNSHGTPFSLQETFRILLKCHLVYQLYQPQQYRHSTYRAVNSIFLC